MKFSIILIICLIFASTAIAQDASTPEGRDALARRTRFYSGMPIRSFPESKLKFKLKDNEYSRSSPAVYNGIPYLGTRGDAAVAVDGFSFKGVYGYDGFGKVDGTPAVTEENVFVGFSNKRIACFDRESGTLKWEYITKGAVASTPLVVDNLIYLSCSEGVLYALNISDGSQKWRFKVTGKLNSPAYYRDMVFISSDMQVYALKKTNGGVIWEFTGAGGPLVVTEDLVLCRQKNGRLVALDLTTGSKVYEHSGSIKDAVSEMALGGNTLVIGNITELYAIDVRAGKTSLWKKTFSRPLAGSPIIVGDVVYVPCVDWNLYAIELATGDEIDKVDIGFSPEGSPAFGNGKLFCVNRETLWTIESESSIPQSTNESSSADLHYAAEYGKIDDVKDFIESKNVEVNSLNSTKRTPLSLAAEYGHTAVVSYLLNKGAVVDIVDDYGRTPLAYSVWYNHADVTDLLVKAGANVNKKDNKGITPLAHGAMENSVKACTIILNAGADVSIIDTNGRDALIHTAWEGKDDMVKILIDKGANVNLQDRDGETALMKAAVYNQLTTVKILLDHGANKAIKNSSGKTALDLAKEKGNSAIVELLK